jgi:putative ABC transport system permease protein
MLSNYLLMAWRQLRRNRLYSLINITGLAVGMAVAMLIGLWIRDETTFNEWHSRHTSLTRILSIFRFNSEVTVASVASVPMEAGLYLRYPAAFKDLALVSEAGHVLAVGNKKLSRWGMWAQHSFPEMFSFRMVAGSVMAFRDPSSLLLSESTARALFGNADALNQLVMVDDHVEMKVGGVYADLPQNTQFYGTGVLLPWDNKANRGTTMGEDWSDHHFELYAELADGVTAAEVSGRIKDLPKPHMRGGFEELALQPMDEWHLYNEFRNGKTADGQIRIVRLFTAIGCFILLLACINFMNLSTARSNKRAKEVGLRKTVGSGRGQLITQFLGESLLVSCLSLVIAIGLAALWMPIFDRLAGKQLVFPWASPGFWLAAGCCTLLVGLLAGSYPAFYLSGFRPVDVLKGNRAERRLRTRPSRWPGRSFTRSGRSAGVARKVLVVIQFTISIALIIGILVVNRQIRYAQDRTVGYAREGLITIGVNEPGLIQHFEALRDELMRSGGVSEVAVSSSPTTDVENDMLGYDWKGRDPHSTPAIGTLFVGYDFGKTVGWQLKEGRDFSRDYSTDSGAFVINEAAARYMGLRHPVGEFIRWHDEHYPIIGVVRDMVMKSPYSPVDPTFFTLRTDRRIHVITVRLNPGLTRKAALAVIQPVFQKYSPGTPFDYSFTEEDYAAKFRAEEQVGSLSGIFTALALFISCLGLFGLASFVAAQRTREIGIRKVLGASVLQLWGMLSREFVVLVLVAFAIAAPIAWFYGQEWLRGFDYRTNFSVWVLVIAGVGAIAIALIVVSLQSVRAARANPVESLRVE